MDELMALFGGAETRQSRRTFSRMGWALTALVLLQIGAQWALLVLASAFLPALAAAEWFQWTVAAVASYVVAFPVTAFLLNGIPSPPKQAPAPLSLGALGSLYLVCAGGTYLSNLVTLTLTGALSQSREEPLANPVDAMMEQPVLFTLVVGCVLAPLLEEYLFRGLLLSRLQPYGGRFAILASALLFSLVHGNLFQMLYAFVVGLVLGGVALQTGQLRWSILLHAGINFISAGLAPLLVLLGSAGELILSGFILLAVAYAIQWTVRHGTSFFPKAPQGAGGMGLGEIWGLFLVNPGMTLFCFFTLLSVWISILT